MEPTLPAFLTLLDVPVEDESWTRLDPSQRRQRTLDAVKRLMLRESQVQPLIVVFEDLHWIDAETQALTLTGSASTSATFSIVSGSPFTLAPGASTTVVVQFNPPGFGSSSSVVQFMSNGNWVAVSVTGGVGVQVSGRVTGTTGTGAGAVSVNLTGAASGTTVTDTTGHYQFFVPPNNRFEEWLLAERERLRELAVEALASCVTPASRRM